MCFAKLDLLMSLLLKYYYDILAETCHFLTGLDFTAAWPFLFYSSKSGKCVISTLNKWQLCDHSQQLGNTAVKHFPLDPWQFRSCDYGAVKGGLCVASSSVCYYVFTMLLSKGLTDLMECLSLYALTASFYSFLCLSIYPSYSTGSRLLFYWICAQPVGIITV